MPEALAADTLPVDRVLPLVLSVTLGANQMLTESPAPPFTIVVSCPLLSPEQTASVEARLQADFLAEGPPGGTLALSCPEDRALAQFEGGGAPLTVEEPRGNDEPVDALLRVAYQLGSALSAPEASRQPETTSPEQPSADLAQPPPKAATEGTPKTDELPEEPLDEEAVDAAPAAPPPAETGAAWNPEVGLLGELWSRAASGTVGLDLGVTGGLSGGLSLRGKATLATGWGLPAELDVKSVTLGLQLAQTVGFDWLSVRVGPAFSLMSFSGANLNPSRYTSTSPAAELDVVVTPHGMTLRPWLSLGVRVYTRDRRVVIGEDEALYVPRAAALVGLGFSL